MKVYIDNSIYTVHYYTYLYMIIIIEKDNDDDDDDDDTDDTDQNDNDNLDDCNDIDDTDDSDEYDEHDSDTKRRWWQVLSLIIEAWVYFGWFQIFIGFCWRKPRFCMRFELPNPKPSKCAIWLKFIRILMDLASQVSMKLRQSGHGNSLVFDTRCGDFGSQVSRSTFVKMFLPVLFSWTTFMQFLI